MPALILQLSFFLDLASEELEYQKWCENSIMTLKLAINRSNQREDWKKYESIFSPFHFLNNIFSDLIGLMLLPQRRSSSPRHHEHSVES